MAFLEVHGILDLILDLAEFEKIDFGLRMNFNISKLGDGITRF